MPPMWRQACPPIPSLPNPRAAILNFVKGVWGKWLIICIQKRYSRMARVSEVTMFIILLPQKNNKVKKNFDSKMSEKCLFRPLNPSPNVRVNCENTAYPIPSHACPNIIMTTYRDIPFLLKWWESASVYRKHVHTGRPHARIKKFNVISF